MTATQLRAAPRTRVHESGRETMMRRLRTVLWIYVVLVFLEGPIRKWTISGAKDAMLIARDPFVVIATYYGYRLGLFAKARFFNFSMVLGGVMALVSLYVASQNGATGSLETNELITLYGWRTDFMHIPVALLLVQVFGRKDLERFSNLILAIALPNALLMYLQYHSGPHAFVNSGLDDQFGQTVIGENIVRPPGIFSFTTGPTALYPFALAFVLAPVVKTTPFQIALRWAGFFGIGVGLIFSGSRYTWVETAIVVVVYLIGVIRFRPAELVRRVPAAIVAAVAASVALSMSSVTKALDLFLKHRVGDQQAQSAFEERIFSFLSTPLLTGYTFPLTGFGLGCNTTVGMALGHKTFYSYGDAEVEPVRHLVESGVLLGSLYILARVYAAIYLLQRAIRVARQSDLTVLMLWAASAPWILVGMLGQSTILGFAVIGAGFTGLAARLALESPSEELVAVG